MVKPARISSAFRKKNQGKVAISLDGSVIAVGKNSVAALREAKKKREGIENEKYVVSKIHYDRLAA